MDWDKKAEQGLNVFRRPFECSQNGPVITNYYSNVCYGQHSDRTFFTNSEGIIIDYHWALSNSWRVNCNNHVLGRPPR